MNQTQGVAPVNGTEKQTFKNVYFEAATTSDQAVKGGNVCFNRDYGTAADAEGGRGTRVEKPAAGNLQWYAGVIVETNLKVGESGNIKIVLPGSLVDMLTEESCTVGVTLLTLKAGSYYAGGANEGNVIGIARQTMDRSETNGMVVAELWGLSSTTPQGRTHTAAGRGFSPLIWQPYEDTIQRILLGDFTLGRGIFEDFTGGLGNVGTTGDYAGKWLATIPTSGTVTYGTAADGNLILTAGSAADQGPQLQLKQPFITPVAGTKVLYECRAKVSAITQEQLFFGIGTIDTTAFAVGIRDHAVGFGNHIGFFSEVTTTTASKLDLSSSKATAVQDSNSVLTMVANAYFKVGFVVDGVTALTGYGNGVAVSNGDIVIATHLPVAAMTPTFVCMYENAAITCTIDWVRCFQLVA